MKNNYSNLPPHIIRLKKEADRIKRNWTIAKFCKLAAVLAAGIGLNIFVWTFPSFQALQHDNHPDFNDLKTDQLSTTLYVKGAICGNYGYYSTQQRLTFVDSFSADRYVTVIGGNTDEPLYCGLICGSGLTDYMESGHFTEPMDSLSIDFAQAIYDETFLFKIQKQNDEARSYMDKALMALTKSNDASEFADEVSPYILFYIDDKIVKRSMIWAGFLGILGALLYAAYFAIKHHTFAVKIPENFVDFEEKLKDDGDSPKSIRQLNENDDDSNDRKG